jgi:twitching motility protein PilT
MGWTFDRILKGARQYGASDIHLVKGVAPAFRVNGEIMVSKGSPLDEDSGT